MAGFEFDAETYIIGVWCTVTPDQKNEWMCCAYRRRPGERYRVTSRVRTVVDEEVWDSNDTKSWQNYTVSPTLTPMEVEAKIHALATLMAVAMESELMHAPVMGDMEAFLKAMQVPPFNQWWHVKTVTREEAERLDNRK